jgi:hypothetical protein
MRLEKFIIFPFIVTLSFLLLVHVHYVIDLSFMTNVLITDESFEFVVVDDEDVA